MKKTLIALSLYSFMVGTSLASTSTSPESSNFLQNRYSDLANLGMHGGQPTPTSQDALFAESYFQRASMLYQWALPIVNMEAMKEGHAKLMNGTSYNKIAVYEDRLKPNTIITTPNSDVIYALAWLNMKETGPLVIEHPAGLQSLMDDMYHQPLRGPLDENQVHGQYLGDIGKAGPDKGKAAKFLILPPGYSRDQFKELSDEYFIYESNTSEVFLFLRSFFMDMDNLTPAVDRVKQTKVYPLKDGHGKKMEFFELSDVPGDSIWKNDHTFYETLDRAVQNMELATFDPYMNGVMNAIGIRKGYKFEPTQEQEILLDKAALTAWKISKNVALNFDELSDPKIGDTWFWKDRPSWVAHALTNNGDQYNAVSDAYWRNMKTGYTNVNALLHMYTNAYSISSGMINAKVKLGAKYAAAYKDSDHNPLIGSCNYSINIPANVPVSLFWSVTAYDAATAGGVNVKNHDWPSLGDRDHPVKNKDGSITLFFGPTAPANAAMAKKNWIQFENESWFSLIRLYGPTKPFFDGEWKPGEFEKINCL
ncbi:DUF1254 domain-containing protein [Vibrio owensii]|uniref:DUF1254 domain-containing protein n=1 Tax=Vibrio owensii TaxID=696485 RepID=UPI002FF31035